jgi:hypothetical protein
MDVRRENISAVYHEFSTDELFVFPSLGDPMIHRPYSYRSAVTKFIYTAKIDRKPYVQMRKRVYSRYTYILTI